MTAARATSPDEGLDPGAHRRTGVSERAPLNPRDLHRPRFPVMRMMTIAAADAFARGADGIVTDDLQPARDILHANGARGARRLEALPPRRAVLAPA